MTVVNADEITFPPPPIQVSAAPAKPVAAKVEAVVEKEETSSQTNKHIFMGVGALYLLGLQVLLLRIFYHTLLFLCFLVLLATTWCGMSVIHCIHR